MKRRRTPEEIRRAGLQALTKILGPVDMVRFLQQYDSGAGDYTAQRAQTLAHLTVDDIVREVQLSRKGRKRPKST